MWALIDATSWGVWAILLPLTGALISFLFPRYAGRIGLTVTWFVLIAVAGLGRQVIVSGVQRYEVGGWGAPLGIDLHADGLSLLMLFMVVVVGMGISHYAPAYFQGETGETNKVRHFWPLWMLLWSGMNALYLSGDIFNLYVTLEIVGLSSVALAALAEGKAFVAAMRYLLVSLLGSMTYLLGVAFFYHGFGTVDLALLNERVTSIPSVWLAVGLMTAALLMKTAVFPLHFWLPPAHSSAPVPVSAMLSALVVKVTFYLFLRLWFNAFPGNTDALGQLLALLGTGAIIWGSFQALYQVRVKLLVAYSTVAQLGYLFIPFALATTSVAVIAWRGAVLFILSHALAKAAMFMAAGNILHFCGHDRIADLDRVVQRLPLTASAFALAGVSIMGLPPSGGFMAKWLLLQAALESGQWWWALVILLGGLLAAAYIFKVLGYAFTQAEATEETRKVPLTMEWVALGLAMAAILLGLVAPWPLSVIEIGAPLEISP